MKTTIVNEKTEIISNDCDIVEIIEKYCGYDFAKLVENRLNNPLEMTDELRKEVLKSTDYYNYESSLDDWNCAGNDIIEECEKQIKYIDERKRIDKNKLYNAFVNIQTIVQNIL